MTGVNDGCQMMRGRCGSIGKREREEGQGKERNLQVRASPSIEKKAHNFRMSPVLVAPVTMKLLVAHFHASSPPVTESLSFMRHRLRAAYAHVC
jgi:hypothetical protein